MRCFGSGFLARLSANGAKLIYASFIKISDGGFQLTHAALESGGNMLISAISAGYDFTYYAGPRLAAGANDPPAALTFRFGPGFAPVLSRFCAVNAASLDPTLTGTGELITLFGSYLAKSAAGDVGQPDADGRYPVEVSGVQVRIAGQLAGILFASSTQINVAAPALSAGGDPVSIEVLSGGHLLYDFSATARLLESAPGLFRVYGTLQAAAVNADGSGNDADHPARPGSRLSLFGTGFGATSPPQDGSAALGSARPLVVPLKVYVNSVEATVLFAGQPVSAPPGLVQIDIVVPDLAASDRYNVNLLLGSAFYLGLVDVAVSAR